MYKASSKSGKKVRFEFLKVVSRHFFRLLRLERPTACSQ